MNTIKLNTIGDSPVVVKKGSQVQSQEKTVEITENGTTEVVPDAGYALSKVTVNTNVQGGSGGEGGVEYLDISGTYGAGELGVFASLVKIKTNDGEYQIAPPMMAYITDSSVDTTKMLNAVALAVNPEDRVVTANSDTTFNEMIGEVLSQFPRITKEQFYSLEA